ncbi:MAG: hypothetical protein ACFB0A_04525 [Croceivirga sp.]
MKSSQKEIDFYKRCDEVLYYLWDPIGVSTIPEARDEYYSYLPKVFEYLNNGADKIKIGQYLNKIQKASMGLDPNYSRNIEIAEILLNWREIIFNR